MKAMSELSCPFCGKPVKPKIGYGGITYFECKNPECGAVVSFGGPKQTAPGFCEAIDPIANFKRRDGAQGQ